LCFYSGCFRFVYPPRASIVLLPVFSCKCIIGNRAQPEAAAAVGRRRSYSSLGPYTFGSGSEHLPYLSRPSYCRTLRLASTSAASAAACAASSLSQRVAYSGSVSQWVASPLSDASSPTTPERSRATSLVTSLGSWGPIYVPNTRLHHGFSELRGSSEWGVGCVGTTCSSADA
jgi:hypothetical protein